jgi:hypothetical protein
VQLSLILGVLLQSGKYKQSILHISLLVKIKRKPLLLKKNIKKNNTKKAS